MTESTLQMKARFDRTLVRQQHTSVRYLVVEATAPSPPQNDARENPPLNLGVVVDASGSMDQHDGGGLSDLDLSRLGAAQQASEGIVQNLDARDTLSLVSFANEAICHVAAVGLDEDGKQTASTAIRELTTRGMTNLHDGWLEGAEQVALQQTRHPEGIHRLLVLTDGCANQGVVDAEELAQVAAGLSARGISTSTVGIGADYSTEQIEPMAEHGGGMLHHTERPSDIIEVVLAELKDMRATVIDDLEINVDTTGDDGPAGGGIGIEVIGLVERTSPRGTSAVLGSLVNNTTRRAIFRVQVPAGCESPLSFRIEASWRSGEERASVQCQAELTPTHDDAVYTEVWNQQVCTEAARIWQADIIRQALAFNRAGDYRRAKHFAKEQRRYFSHYTRRLDEGEELYQKLKRALDRMSRPMRERSRKEIGTAMLKQERGAYDYRVSEAPKKWDEYLEE
jgi:Ca-activated chloride channel family protein